MATLNRRLNEFVDYYNNKRYYESLNNITPADVYFGRQERILKKRSLMKEKTMQNRRKLYLLTKSEI